MSGLINSAGSRSGIIGTTELDYEEGAWSPLWTGGSSAPNTPANATGSGTYTKIGRTVHINFYLGNRDTSGASGDMAVTGQPFACNGGTDFGNFMCYNTSFDSSYITTLRMNASSITFTESRNNATWTWLDISAGSSRYMYGSATYTIT